MSGHVELWIWDTVNSEWVKLAGTAGGAMSIHAIVEELNDIEDVNVAAPADDDFLYWDDVAGEWKSRAIEAADLPAHKDTHDPEDGSDKLDVAVPVKVGAANAEGNAHSFARSNHVHEREHAKFTDANAVSAMGVLGDGNPLNHDKYTDADALAAAEAKYDDHSARHEDTGLDEINVAGLDGVLTDDQHIIDAEAVSAMGVLGDANPLRHDRYTNAEAVDAIEADGNLPLASVTFIIDGGGAEIALGEHGHLEIPFACTINRVTMLADQSGSIVVDIWKDTYGNFPPLVGDSITAAAKPTITTAQESQDATLTGWTTAITAGDVLAFNVDSVTDIERVTISLKVTKT